MITLWTLQMMAFFCNWALVSSSILTPLKDDSSLQIFKDPPNEFEYVLKRHGVEESSVNGKDTDSKERRSSSSGFIRFGRGQAAYENFVSDGEADSKVSRHPRWKPSDVIIRFGRSSFKRGRNDANFIRFGRNAHIPVVPADLDLSAVCSVLMSSSMISDAELHSDVLRLLRLCNSLNKITGEINLDSFEDRINSNRHE
ncbi:PREDICTED: FMRFamide-related peptides-like [Dinoponera quadriceps]|uniref:FMRFamide-related peptides-like n=1 Tax=Dinoponera quadriceps TaxID=609295 RepID=A0A6P3YEH3_DINQU|nr:PREDICTED: FMRFamide-related peptides-like [Dinoponera quadriceps]